MDNDSLHREILDMIEAEKAALKKKLDAFYSSDNQSAEKYNRVNGEIISALERVFQLVEKNNASDSVFLTNTLRPLRETYDKAVQFRSMFENDQFTASEDGQQGGVQSSIGDDSQLVYITLYLVGGHEIHKWEQQLRSLAKLVQTRPIYIEENDAEKAVKGHMTMCTVGYATVVVKKNAIINTGEREDQQGRTMVALAEHAILDSQQILKFVLGGDAYSYKDGKLAPMKT